MEIHIRTSSCVVYEEKRKVWGRLDWLLQVFVSSPRRGFRGEGETRGLGLGNPMRHLDSFSRKETRNILSNRLMPADRDELHSLDVRTSWQALSLDTHLSPCPIPGVDLDR